MENRAIPLLRWRLVGRNSRHWQRRGVPWPGGQRRADGRRQRRRSLASVVALEGWFVHRLRGVEGRDGNALNEVRLLALGVTENGGYFPSAHGIRWQSAMSVTGYRAGDRIRLSEAVFSRLAGVFLDGIAAKFPQ